jgi:hypothetical protein
MTATHHKFIIVNLIPAHPHTSQNDAHLRPALRTFLQKAHLSTKTLRTFRQKPTSTTCRSIRSTNPA